MEFIINLSFKYKFNFDNNQQHPKNKMCKQLKLNYVDEIQRLSADFIPLQNTSSFSWRIC